MIVLLSAMSLSVDDEGHQLGEEAAFLWEGKKVAGRKARDRAHKSK